MKIKPRMGTTKDFLDISLMEGQFVQIMTRNFLLDHTTGKQTNHSQTAYLRGCDGMFVYYSFDPEGPFSGFIPVSEIMDVVRVDHVQNLLAEEEE